MWKELVVASFGMSVGLREFNARVYLKTDNQSPGTHTERTLKAKSADHCPTTGHEGPQALDGMGG